MDEEEPNLQTLAKLTFCPVCGRHYKMHTHYWRSAERLCKTGKEACDLEGDTLIEKLLIAAWQEGRRSIQE